jgi:hypothetical protein
MKAKVTNSRRAHAGETLTVIFLETEGLTAISPDPSGEPTFDLDLHDVIVFYRYSEVELIPANDWDRGFLRGQNVEVKRLKRASFLRRMRRLFTGFRRRLAR